MGPLHNAERTRRHLAACVCHRLTLHGSATSLVLCLTFVMGTAVPGRVLAHASVHQRVARLSAEIERAPEDAQLLIARALAHRSHGDLEAALADLHRATVLDPRRDDVRLELGRTWLRAGRLKQALAALRRYTEARPGDPEGHLALAEALRGSGLPGEASREYTRAMESHPRPAPELYRWRAQALMSATGDVDAAFAGLEEGLARSGSAALALYAVELEVAAGRTDDALARLQRLALRTPAGDRWQLRRAEILERGGRRAEAEQAYLAALAAIRHLPSSRRKTRMWERREAVARDALVRLRSPSPEENTQ